MPLIIRLVGNDSCVQCNLPSLDEITENKVVIPDLSVIYDKTGLIEQKYVGVPTVIIEILSSSNQSQDLVTQLNLYMQYGVKEYWIVNLISDGILIYQSNTRFP